MSIYKRYMIFTIGILLQSAGIALVVKSLLGTSPISSVPYVLSLVFPYSLGEMTFLINMVFLLAQVLILWHKFNPLQLLQIPITAVFAFFIDVSMAIFQGLAPEAYLSKFVVLLLGAAFIALGVAMQVIANVIMLAGEGIVNAIALRWHFDFGRVKTCFDTTLVILAVLLSMWYLGTVEGIREGTLISALITGSMARFFIRHLSYVDKTGSMVFRVGWFKH